MRRRSFHLFSHVFGKFFLVSREFLLGSWDSLRVCRLLAPEKALRHPSKGQTRRQLKETLQIRKQCCRKPARNPTDSRVPRNSSRVPQFLRVPALLRARHARNVGKLWRPTRLMGTLQETQEHHSFGKPTETHGEPASVKIIPILRSAEVWTLGIFG